MGLYSARNGEPETCLSKTMAEWEVWEDIALLAFLFFVSHV